MLKKLLQRYLQGDKLRYKDGEWEIGVAVRTWDSIFEIYYNGICKFQGNTLDKTIQLCNAMDIDVNKCLQIIKQMMPEYTIIDFNHEEI